MRNYSRIYAVYDADNKQFVSKFYVVKAAAISWANKLKKFQPNTNYVVRASAVDWIDTYE